MDEQTLNLFSGSIVNGLREFMKQEKKNAQFVIVKQRPTSFLKSKLKRISSVSAKLSTAQGAIENPVDEDAVIKSISIVPNATFKSSGRLQILVNEVEVFSDDAVGDYTDVPVLDIALPSEGKIIKRGKSVEFFVWGSGAITVYVQFDKKEAD